MGYIARTDLVSLGFDTSNIATTVLDSICEQATQLVDAFCEQALAETSVTEFLTGRAKGGSTKLFPSFLPVSSITSITEYAYNQAGKVHTDYRIDNNAGVINVFPGPYACYEAEFQVVYTHGYATIPDDVKTATLYVAQMLLDTYFSSSMTSFSTTNKLKDGERSIEILSGRDIPDNAKSLLRKYKRIR